MIKKKVIKRIIIFLYPILTYFKITLIGQIALSEPIAVLSFLNLSKTKKLFQRVPDIRKISLALATFLLAQIVSDLLNHSAINDMLKGWASIIMTWLVILFFIRVFVKYPEFIVIYFIGNFLRYAFFGETNGWAAIQGNITDWGLIYIFELRVAPMLTNLILAVSWFLLRSRNKNKWIALIILFGGYGLFLLLFGYRSMGSIFVLASIIFLYRNKLKFLTPRRLIPFLIAGLLLFQGLYMLYVSKSLKGDLGKKNKEQAEIAGNPYNPINLLKVGRAPAFVGLTAALEKPWIGRGSWAKDVTGEYTLMEARLMDMNISDIVNTENIIPTHSIIIGAWVDAGIIGCIAMLYLWLFCLKRLMVLLRMKESRNSPFFAILVFMLLDIIWVFWFSPLSSIRYDIPTIIAFITVLNNKVVKRKSMKPVIKQQPVLATVIDPI